MTEYSRQHQEEYRLMVRELKRWATLTLSDQAVLKKATSGNLSEKLARVVDYMFQKYLEWELME